MRILLVEDHPGMRFGVRSLLRHAGGMEVVGEAADAEEAMKLAVEKTPDVVVLDIQIKGGQSGIELCREIKSLPGPPKILIYTAFSVEEAFLAARAAGADGFVNKAVDLEELPEAVRKVYSGESVLLDDSEQERAETLLKSLDVKDLTPREKEVFDLVVRHYSNPDIAAELHITEQTVKNHVGKALQKLSIKGRRDLFGRMRDPED